MGLGPHPAYPYVMVGGCIRYFAIMLFGAVWGHGVVLKSVIFFSLQFIPGALLRIDFACTEIVSPIRQLLVGYSGPSYAHFSSRLGLRDACIPLSAQVFDG